MTPSCFAHLTALLQPVAPLAVLLEGGYNLDVTARSVAACMRVLLGERPPPLARLAAVPSASGLATIREVITVQVPDVWLATKMHAVAGEIRPHK